jgi:secreted Zn-dependent insulinase-like peptidase
VQEKHQRGLAHFLEHTQFTCFTGTKVQILTRLLSQEEHQRGLAHFLEHALFLGTEKFPSQKDMKQLLRR